VLNNGGIIDDELYDVHIFMCTNTRETGVSCGASGAVMLHKYAKDKIKSLDPDVRTKVRLNSSGCLNRCKHKSVVVIYPEGIWYTCRTPQDVDRIIDQHILQKNMR